MQINRENYEAYFLDYHEGNLTTVEVANVLLFVENNPDLRSVFESFKNINIVPDNDVTFPDKSVLLKKENTTPTVNATNIDKYLIDEIENNLSATAKKSLKTYIKEHPLTAQDRKLYALTKLESDKNIIYPYKSALKKHIIPAYRKWIAPMAVAASIALLIGIYFGQGNKLQPETIVKNSRNTNANANIHNNTNTAHVLDKALTNVNDERTTVNTADTKKTINSNQGTYQAQKQQKQEDSLPATRLQGYVKLLAIRDIKSEISVLNKQYNEDIYLIQISLYIKENEDYINSIMLADQLAYNEKLENSKIADSKNKSSNNNGLLTFVKNILKNTEIAPNTTIMNPIKTLANIGRNTLENLPSKNITIDIVKDKELKTNTKQVATETKN